MHVKRYCTLDMKMKRSGRESVAEATSSFHHIPLFAGKPRLGTPALLRMLFLKCHALDEWHFQK